MNNYKKDCAHCVCLVSVNGMWFCDEVQQLCADAECPYIKEN